MLEFDEAIKRILAEAAPRDGERLPLERCNGRYLAESARAPTAMPAFDYSAMDGFAVRIGDFSGDGPWNFPIVGESRTGHPTPKLLQNTVCRIFTGAALPRGADTVVIQEDVTVKDQGARFAERPVAKAHVRKRGEDLEAGQVALDAGQRLDAFKLGLLAALDFAQLLVARRPRVSILCSGDELRPVGDKRRSNTKQETYLPGLSEQPGSFVSGDQIPDSNSVALMALAEGAGAVVTVGPLVSDEAATAELRVAEALVNTDLLLTVGGVSVGEHDVMRGALARAGVHIDFYKVKIKPGKPLVFGRKDNTLVLGLPGNPVSAQLTFSLFGLPLLRKLQGANQLLPKRRRAKLALNFKQRPGRLGFYRGLLEKDEVRILEGQASGSTTSLAWADALVLVPPETTELDAGSDVEVLLLSEL